MSSLRESHSAKISSLTDEKSKLQGSVDTITLHLEDAKAEIEDLKEKIEKLKQEKVEDSKLFEAKNAANENSIASMKNETVSLEGKLQLKELELKELLNKMDDVEKRNKSNLSELSDRNSVIEVLNSEISKHKKEIETINNSLSNKEVASKDGEAALTKLKKQFDQLSKSKNEVDALMEKKIQEHAKLA